MAKYTRFDPRNKKKDRNKYNSLQRDIRIRYEEKGGARRFPLDKDSYTTDENLTEDESEYT